MMSFLRKNLFYKIASLVLAIFLWLYVGNAFSGAQEITVPLEPIGLEAGMLIANQENLPKTVTLRVQGGKELMGQLTSKDYRATVNLQGASIGQGTYPVTIQGPQKVQVLAKDPVEVVITLDKYDEREIPVVVRPKSVPEGYVVMEAYSKQTTVEITGPSQKIKEIEQAVAELAVEPLNTLQTGAAALRLQDKKGKIFDQTDISITPKAVNASIRLESDKATGQKKLDNVVIDIQGLNVNYTYKLATPQASVTIEGLMKEMSKVKAENIKLFVDVSALQPGNHDVPVQITVPAGMKSVRIEPERITITVQDKSKKEGGNTVETPNGQPKTGSR